MIKHYRNHFLDQNLLLLRYLVYRTILRYLKSFPSILLSIHSLSSFESISLSLFLSIYLSLSLSLSLCLSLEAHHSLQPVSSGLGTVYNNSTYLNTVKHEPRTSPNSIYQVHWDISLPVRFASDKLRIYR